MKLTKDIFAPARLSKPTGIGVAGYDNARENIDPHIRTMAVSTREITTEKVPVNNNDVVNKLALDTAIAALPVGDVTAAANLTDGTLVQGDGGAKGIKTTTVTAAEVALNTASRHAESHTVASHSDTSATGGQLDTLTDNSMSDTLHRHSELSASDGSPDAVLVVDSAGGVKITQTGTSGKGFWVSRNLAAGSTDNPLCYFENLNADDDQPCLQLYNAGSGKTLAIVDTGPTTALDIDNDGTGHSIAINSSVNSGDGINVNQYSATNEAIWAQDRVGYTGSYGVLGIYGHASATSELVHFANIGTGDGIFLDNNGNGRGLNIDNEGTAPCIMLQSNQDVEVIDFDACADGGTTHTTLAGSLKIQMPNGSTGYINFYT